MWNSRSAKTTSGRADQERHPPAGLTKNGIPRGAAKKALEIAERKGRFTIFALGDALTRLAGEQANAGERTDADERAIALVFIGHGNPALVQWCLGEPGEVGWASRK